jgi:hypothetical protein
MRRQEIGPWESAARDASERLRQALALLLEQERAFDAGTVEDEKFFEALNAADRTKVSVDQWWQEWRVGTANLKTSRAVVLSVFRGCLPPLLGAVDLYGQSLSHRMLMLVMAIWLVGGSERRKTCLRSRFSSWTTFRPSALSIERRSMRLWPDWRLGPRSWSLWCNRSGSASVSCGAKAETSCDLRDGHGRPMPLGNDHRSHADQAVATYANSRVKSCRMCDRPPWESGVE